VKLRAGSVQEPTTPLERLLIGIASLVVAIGAIAALSGFFAARDQAGVSASGAGPGQAFRDLGHAHLRPGELRPVYDSSPPTSGAHIPQPILQQHAVLDDDQLLDALERGDVVVMYGGPTPPVGLDALASSVGSPFSPALAAAGQAVVVASRPGTQGLIAVAWTHMLRVTTLSDPRLREFADYWLGKGAPQHR
jgi:Protein of unknown function (DUF3105)